MAGPKNQPKVCKETLAKLKYGAELSKEVNAGKISPEDLQSLKDMVRLDKSFHPTGKEVVEH